MNSNNEILKIKDIKAMLPHRYPFLLVDRIKGIVLNESAVGIKNVSANEEFFQGHFPDEPVMPGVLQIEALAQTACVLVLKSLGEKAPKHPGILFTTIEKVKFRKPVPLDTQVMAYGKITRNTSKFFTGVGAIMTMDGEILAEGTANYIKLKTNQIATTDIHDDVNVYVEDNVTEINI